jgi:orc1/cdc6 family replication initiation protein
MSCNFSVVTNPEYFQEEYIPDEIVHREAQVDDLMHCLKPVFQKQKPMHAWIYGEAGTGKTMIARYILRKIESNSNAKGVYINCWSYNSYFSILDKLIRELRILDAEKPEAGFKLDRIKQCIGNKPVIIILDEIDLLKKCEIEALLYNLGNLTHAGLILVGNAASVLLTADERIKSRLNAKLIACRPYTDNELSNILQQRAFNALGARTWKEETMQSITQLSNGDARTGIQILRNAAFNADKERSQTLEQRHVRMGHNLSENVKKGFLLERLTAQHRLLYELVKKNKEIASGELWKTYCRKCKRQKLRPIALRTFSDYMSKMIDLGLIQWDWAPVRGKVRNFRVAD